MSNTCPHCGYCDKCGRAGSQWTYPYPSPIYPYVWPHPYYSHYYPKNNVTISGINSGINNQQYTNTINTNSGVSFQGGSMGAHL